jgi:excisionase family DNA binding protein
MALSRRATTAGLPWYILSMQTTQAKPETHELLTVEEAAAKCRVSRPTMYRLVRAGIVPAVRVGAGDSGLIRIPADELRRWLFDDEPDDAA